MVHMSLEFSYYIALEHQKEQYQSNNIANNGRYLLCFHYLLLISVYISENPIMMRKHFVAFFFSFHIGQCFIYDEAFFFFAEHI